MKTNLLKVIKFENAKLESKIKRYDLDDIALDWGDEKSFVIEYPRLQVLSEDRTVSFLLYELIFDEECYHFYIDYINTIVNEYSIIEVIYPENKINNSNYFRHLKIGQPLPEKYHTLGLSFVDIFFLVKHFNFSLYMFAISDANWNLESNFLHSPLFDVHERYYLLGQAGFCIYVRKDNRLTDRFIIPTETNIGIKFVEPKRELFVSINSQNTKFKNPETYVMRLGSFRCFYNKKFFKH
jgi:hypothetical protein